MHYTEDLGEQAVTGWGPGWAHSGMRARTDADDGDAQLGLFIVDDPETATIATIAIAFEESRDDLGYAATLGIELTFDDCAKLSAKLTEAMSARLAL